MAFAGVEVSRPASLIASVCSAGSGADMTLSTDAFETPFDFKCRAASPARTAEASATRSLRESALRPAYCTVSPRSVVESSTMNPEASRRATSLVAESRDAAIASGWMTRTSAVDASSWVPCIAAIDRATSAPRPCWVASRISTRGVTDLASRVIRSRGRKTKPANISGANNVEKMNHLVRTRSTYSRRMMAHNFEPVSAMSTDSRLDACCTNAFKENVVQRRLHHHCLLHRRPAVLILDFRERAVENLFSVRDDAYGIAHRFCVLDDMGAEDHCLLVTLEIHHGILECLRIHGIESTERLVENDGSGSCTSAPMNCAFCCMPLDNSSTLALPQSRSSVRNDSRSSHLSIR